MTQSKSVAVYPGTFDPITNGHLDILERALHLFQTVVVTIAPNIRKNPLFTTDERNHYVSSSLVKEVASLGGDVTGLVPSAVVAALAEKFASEPRGEQVPSGYRK